MINLDFKKFVEDATSTSCVAVFARPIFSQPITRTEIEPLLTEKKKKKKKHKKKH